MSVCKRSYQRYFHETNHYRIKAQLHGITGALTDDTICCDNDKFEKDSKLTEQKF